MVDLMLYLLPLHSVAPGYQTGRQRRKKQRHLGASVQEVILEEQDIHGKQHNQYGKCGDRLEQGGLFHLLSVVIQGKGNIFAA